MRTTTALAAVATLVLTVGACDQGDSSPRSASTSSTSASTTQPSETSLLGPSTSAPPAAEDTSTTAPADCRATWRASRDSVIVTIDSTRAAKLVVETTTTAGKSGPRRDVSLLGPTQGFRIEIETDERIRDVTVSSPDIQCSVTESGRR